MGFFKRIFNKNKKEEPQNKSGGDPPQDGRSPSLDVEMPSDDGQGRSPTATGFVQTKRGRFSRKKRVETNLGPDGKPVYTGAQLESAVDRMKSRKKARQQAKEEEKNYVEYRKAEILRSFQPKVGILRVGDESFPKRRRLAMGFGERKAHFLAIRPKAKYATWVGRKKGVIEAKPKEKKGAVTAKAVVTDHSMLPDHSVRTVREDRTHKGTDGDKKTDAGTFDKDNKDKMTAETKSEKKPSAETPTSAAGDKKSGHKYDFKNPYWDCIWKKNHPKKEPVWSNVENEEMSEEDLPVDMDILEKVCNGEKVLAQRPFNKAEFIPYGPISLMKTDDELFARDTFLFANTVESVISLQPEEEKKKKLPPMIPPKIKWSEAMTCVMYHPLTRIPHKLDPPYQEEFHMIVRTKESVLKAQEKKAAAAAAAMLTNQ